MKNNSSKQEEKNKKTSSCRDSGVHPTTPVSRGKTTELTKASNSSNPFFKEIDRHYGSFKCRILGNYSKKFNSLPLPFLGKWGRGGSGCSRKKLQSKDYTAIIYANGTVEIKPSRDKGLNPEELQASFYAKARECLSALRAEGVVTSQLKMNRPPKYGVEDAVARTVKGEFKTRKRGIDSSPGRPHVDNYGLQALLDDLQLSDVDNAGVAHARLTNPGMVKRIEGKMNFIIDTQADFAKNIALHLNVLREQRDVLRAIGKSLKPARPRLPAMKNSATFRGVN